LARGACIEAFVRLIRLIRKHILKEAVAESLLIQEAYELNELNEQRLQHVIREARKLRTLYELSPSEGAFPYFRRPTGSLAGATAVWGEFDFVDAWESVA
jgi:hypothetical protein